MAEDATVTLMTTRELLALPDDGIDRELIRGELREKPMTRRNRWHASLEARIAYLLHAWLEQQPKPKGNVLSGEVGCRLRHDPDTTVGIDVVYVSAELAAHDPEDTTLVDGVPVLAVEILSPSDTVEEVSDKIDEYLAVGVGLVWLVDPHFQTVQVFRKGAAPQLVNVTHELSGEPFLPGFRVPAARIFSRD